MIALVGATGRIGRHVANKLADRRGDVVALTRSPAAAGLAVPTVGADLRDPASVRAALDGASRMFLLTPHGPDQDLLEAAAIDAALDAGVQRIVKVSGSAASLGRNAVTTTAVAHWRSEQRIERSGVEFALLRPSFLMQNLLAMAAPTVAAAGVLAAPMGQAPIAMVDARDVAACAVAALTADDEMRVAWSLTGSRSVAFAQIAELLGAPYLALPPSLAAKGMRRRGAGDWEVGHALRMAAYFAAGADAAVSPTVGLLTGRPPRTIEAFLGEHADAFVARRPLSRVLHAVLSRTTKRAPWSPASVTSPSTSAISTPPSTSSARSSGWSRPSAPPARHT